VAECCTRSVQAGTPRNRVALPEGPWCYLRNCRRHLSTYSVGTPPKGQGSDADLCLHLETQLRTRGAAPPLLRMPTRCAQKQLHFVLLYITFVYFTLIHVAGQSVHVSTRTLPTDGLAYSSSLHLNTVHFLNAHWRHLCTYLHFTYAL
jgi:hypothetical protein